MSAIPVLRGLHHVTAVTGVAKANLEFYTRILGLRLVKKTVNQDDLSAYHLFYADEVGSPGTELTFFDWKRVPAARPGAGTVSETALRVVGGVDTLERWARWFDKKGVGHGAIEGEPGASYPSLPFQDPEGQRLRLVAEPAADADAVSGFRPWRGSAAAPAPEPVAESQSEFPGDAIVGLSAVTLTVWDLEPTTRVLTEVLGFRPSAGDPALFEVGDGGPGAQLRLLASSGHGSMGVGGVHHVAWRAADGDEQRAWLERLARYGVATSGLIDRFYFQSLYFRIPGGILFEIATDGPGFTADGEDFEHLGGRLSLPPFLEKSRAQIEAGLEPLDDAPRNR